MGGRQGLVNSVGGGFGMRGAAGEIGRGIWGRGMGKDFGFEIGDFRRGMGVVWLGIWLRVVAGAGTVNAFR